MRLAILSDLHCHHSSCQGRDTFLLSDSLRFPAVNHPVEALLKLISSKGLQSDYVLMLGDLTNKVDIQGLISGWNFVCEIADALNAKGIMVTIGNHDVDIRDINNLGHPNHAVKNFHRSFPFGDDKAKAKFWADGYVIVEPEVGVCFVIINSTHSNITDVELKRGSVSEAIIEAVDSDLLAVKSDLKIMLCHHHPLLHSEAGWNDDHVMLNGEKLVGLAEKHKFSLLLHGHKHFPRITKSNGNSGLPLPVFASGSFSAMITGNLATVTRNQFHIVDMEGGASRKGLIRSWEYGIPTGWEKTEYRSSGFPSRTGFGFQGSIPNLSTEIARFFESAGHALLNWAEVEKQFPDIPFLNPAELRELSQRLEDDSSLEIYPESPNAPKTIGKIV